MKVNHFLLPIEQYQRHMNPLADWLKQTAWYLSKLKNLPYEDCLAKLREKIKNKEIVIEDPNVVFFYRGYNGDREKRVAPLTKYIGKVIRDNNILTATGTSYLHPSVQESLIVGYLDMNVKLRSQHKKVAQKYEFAGDAVKHKYYHNSQDNKKRANNAVSGGFVAEGSVINNKSAHSSLTSTTRSIASLSNASNERLIAGNRHYYSPSVILNNIVSTCSEIDYATLEAAMVQFNLIYPSVENVMQCITYSSDLYFRDRRKIHELQTFVEKLLPIERAAFVYTGDLYHLRMFNPDFMRHFITQLSMKGDTAFVENARKRIYEFDEQIINYAHQVCLNMLRDKGKDYEKLTDTEISQLFNTCFHIEQTIIQYKLFIKAFFLTLNHPPAVASIPNMVRRSVVLSDTDSTMFSVDDWVQWYFGSLPFTDEGYAVGGAIMYMATQSIAHILACFSANMNVERKRIHTLSMKPEYVFPVFAQTSVAKHYYTAMMVKEGSVYKDIKMEIKGVHMKDSTVPKNITEAAAVEMKRVIRDIMSGKKLSLTEILSKAIEYESDIISSIRKGETKYLKRIRIKERSAYKNGGTLKPGEFDKTNFRHFTLWEKCFAPKYGHIAPPPYSAVSVPLTLPNKSAVKEWLAVLPDRTFATNFEQWMIDHGMDKIGLLHLPVEFCQNNGVPEELNTVLNDKQIAMVLTRSFRNIVESHGYFSKPNMLFYEQVTLTE